MNLNLDRNQLNRCIGRALTCARRAKMAGNAELRMALRMVLADLAKSRAALRRDDMPIARIYATTAGFALTTAQYLNH